MAKKSFKGGLDNLLASAGLKKKTDEKPVVEDKNKSKKEISEDKKHWLLLKNDELNQELKLWRTGKISVKLFHDSLKKHGLKYDASTNKIEEI
jgi:hypothetical protein